MKSKMLLYFKSVNINKVILANFIYILISVFPILISSIFFFGINLESTILDKVISIVTLSSSLFLQILLNLLIFETNKIKLNNSNTISKIGLIITLVLFTLQILIFLLIPLIYFI